VILKLSMSLKTPGSYRTNGLEVLTICGEFLTCNKYPSVYALVFRLFSLFPIISCTHLPSGPCMPYALPISSSFSLTSLVTYRLLVYSSVLNLEAVGLVDTLVHFYQIKRRYIPEERPLLLLYFAAYSAAHSSVL
jgi:hypothetical protein